MGNPKKIFTSFRKRIQSFHYFLWRLEGSLRGRSIPAYWWRGNFNLGDLVTPHLVRHYGYFPIPSSPQEARLAAAGSILEQLPLDYDGVIMGSGFIGAGPQRFFPKAHILAVRGKLTRARLGRGDEVALGDPGLLTSLVFPERKRKKYRLGIVPHYIDHHKPVYAQLMSGLDGRTLLIDIMDYPQKVVGLIDQCEYVISSTLHGLIVADSLGIPNAWISSNGITGGRFKFDDYYSSLDLAEEPIFLRGDETLEELIGDCSLKPQGVISDIKGNLADLWSDLGAWVPIKTKNLKTSNQYQPYDVFPSADPS